MKIIYLNLSSFNRASISLPLHLCTWQKTCAWHGDKTSAISNTKPFYIWRQRLTTPNLFYFLPEKSKIQSPIVRLYKKAQRQLFLWYRMHLPLNYDRRVNSLYRYCLIINNKTLDTLYSDFGCRKKEQSGFSYQNEEKTGKVTLRLTLIKRYVNEKIIDYLCHL